MVWIRGLFTLLVVGAGVALFTRVLWGRRLKHIWPKRGELKIVNPMGLWSGIAEVVLQKRVLQNRPIVGILHLPLFYGFVAFGLKSLVHVLNGFRRLRRPLETPELYNLSLDVFAVTILVSVIALAVRRYVFAKDRLTHMKESGLVLFLIALLMGTHLFEHAVRYNSVLGQINWWIHLGVLAFFPSLIAYGKHLHIMMAPINVVLRHMTELPSDRPVNGADFDMEDEEKFDEEYARVGLPNGVSDFSLHALLDTTACIECGRCNDACPSAEAGLMPREHFILALKDPKTDADGLKELVPMDVLATCTQCRACDTVCPVGNRPAMTALEMRGRMSFEGHYPPRKLKEGGEKMVEATGNIFGAPESTRSAFIEKAKLPIYDHSKHEVLLILGCQGGNSPEVQPIVEATGRLFEAAGVPYGVLPEETCWGEGLLHGGGLMESWPVYYQERIDFLKENLGGDAKRTMVTICPHCNDTIKTQYTPVGGEFSNVVSHTVFLRDLVKAGRLRVNRKIETLAVHHPCKVIHNDEDGAFDELLEAAGVIGRAAGNSPQTPQCCGGGGGGFLWDSPAPVNKNRWKQLTEETGLEQVVTSCPGCHRMLNVAKTENAKITDVATLLFDRLGGPAAQPVGAGAEGAAG